MSPTAHHAHQVSHRLLRQMLRGFLRERVACGEVGSVACRAVAALYTLLLAHPIDRYGRCASCGWAGVVFGRRRRCRIYRMAHSWLHQPCTTLLLASLASELGLDFPPPATGPGRDWPGLTVTDRADTEQTDTEVLPRIVAEPDDSAHQTPETSALVTGGALCPV